MQIELWGQIFRDFRQVKQVSIDSSAGRLDIIIEGHNDILHTTSIELDESLHEFSGNPYEVVTSFLKKHKIIVYYQNSLVGFFDIQAYSFFIENTGMVEAVKLITYCLQTIKSIAKTDALAVKLNHWILSDSIIVVVDTNRHPLFSGSISLFLKTCSMIMRQSLVYNFPLRGAIGGGDFYNDRDIMVSSALVDAAKYEKEQDWLGAVLTHKAREVIDITKTDLLSGDLNPHIRFGPIPWKPESGYAKKEESREMFYIKPYMDDIDDKNWVKFLPPYFNAPLKINNSHCLYAE